MLNAIPLRAFLILGWVCVAAEVLFVVSLLSARNMGDDAAGRGLGTAYGAVLAPIVLLVGGTLLWGTLTGSRPKIVAGSLLSALPLFVMIFVTAKGMVRKAGRAWVATGAGAFESAALTEMARLVDREDPAMMAHMVKGLSADFTLRDKMGRTLLGHAVHKAMAASATEAHTSIVRALLENGVPYAADAVEPGGDWVAVVATNATDNHNALIELGLKHGADPNAKDPWDDQPMIFNLNMTPAKIDLLIKYGADLTRKPARADRKDWTPIMGALADGKWELAHHFLEKGVPTEYVAPDGRSVQSLLAEADALAKRMGYATNESAEEFRRAMSARTK